MQFGMALELHCGPCSETVMFDSPPHPDRGHIRGRESSPAKTTPESADLEGRTPQRNVEEDMLEDRKEAGALQAQPELQGSCTVGPRSHPEGDAAPARTPYECRVCKKRFRYESQFTLHQRTHTRERPFRCNVCAKGFMQPSDLRVHQRVHTGEKPHCCDLCPKRFAHDSTLRAHKRVHTREKPFQCEHCDKAFSHRGNLNVHRRTHSGLKPYVCPECHGAFRQLGTFKRHQKTHFRMTRQ
ncbi:Zinc finger and SCAN domain-containing protein 5B [Camelus dromedarius]|uniref:Zinc finger and SCAN domain-containing protein 5B n=1 Tax=Camelus dromedarius TaxID=9838 RepID=A0A5N4DQ68_CAMDR|nr:Zinc finger and SCAN domain-containing protein 5B [Camelus dromedarius]